MLGENNYNDFLKVHVVNLIFPEIRKRWSVKKRKYLVNEDGEIEREIENDCYLRVLVKKQMESYERIKEEEWMKKQLLLDKGAMQLSTIGKYCRVDINILNEYLEQLDIYEKAFILSILPYMGYEDTKIKFRNGKNIGINDLESITNISKGKILKVVKSLCAKKIIRRVKIGKKYVIYINPKLVLIGNKVPSNTVKMFR